MWPFGKNKNKNKKEKNESAETPKLGNSEHVLCRISNTYGICGNYSTVQAGLYDRKSGNLTFRDISRKFDGEEYARKWKDCVLKSETSLGKRIAKLLYVLGEQTEKYKIRWLYEYVLSMVEYYSSALVKDRSIFEVMIAVQIDDMGDEIFDCLYSTEVALFGKSSGQRYMSYVETDGTLGDFEKQQGFESATNNNGNADRQFSHIGSNVKNLLGIHWKVNLTDIQV